MVTSTADLLPLVVRQALRSDLHEAADPLLPSLLRLLSEHGADECWHKHSTFKQHLFGVWRILYVWRQSQALCRCGLFHSAYSNSYVNLAIFDAGTERSLIAGLVGEQAEGLIYKFCTVPRHDLVIDQLLSAPEGTDFSVGLTTKHIWEGTPIHLPPIDLVRILVFTMADFVDQLYSWQDQLTENTDGKLLFAGHNPRSLWPGANKPGLWMSAVSRMGALARRIWLGCSEAERGEMPMPPVFDTCTVVLAEANEREARDAYWLVVTSQTEPEMHAQAQENLLRVTALNPHVAEPWVLLAQLHLHVGAYEEAESAARKALALLCAWGTVWDKRVGWEGWVAWTRVLLQRSVDHVAWPDSAFGIINLGLVA